MYSVSYIVTKIQTMASHSQPGAPGFVWKVKGFNPEVGETLGPQEMAFPLCCLTTAGQPDRNPINIRFRTLKTPE